MADIIAAGGILCITKMMHRQFLVDYPEAHDILNRDYAPRSSVELLDLVQNGTCDAVVMTDTDFEAAIRRNENYCSQMVMLRDAALLEIDVIYPHGSYQSHGNRYKHSLDFRGYLQIRNSFDRMIGSDWFREMYEHDRRHFNKNIFLRAILASKRRRTMITWRKYLIRVCMFLPLFRFYFVSLVYSVGGIDNGIKANQTKASYP